MSKHLALVSTIDHIAKNTMVFIRLPFYCTKMVSYKTAKQYTDIHIYDIATHTTEQFRLNLSMSDNTDIIMLSSELCIIQNRYLKNNSTCCFNPITKLYS